jgi:HEAT repeat protein
MLEDKDPGMRGGAALALGELGRHHKDVAPALLRALHTKDAYELGAVAWALSMLRKDPERCVPALVQALKRPSLPAANDDLRHNLIAGLGRFGPAAKSAIPTLAEIAANEKEDFELRHRAINALQMIGPDSKDTLLALQAKCGPRHDLSRRISVALKAIEANAGQRTK